MDTGSIGLKVLEILSPVLLAALTWAAAKLAQLIRAKVQNEYLKGVLVRLDDAVFTAVKDLQQSVVEQIKAASADGKITDEEKRQIKEKAMAAVKSHLGTKGLAEAVKILGLEGGALEGLLSSKVEAAVHDLRRAGTSGGERLGTRRRGVPFGTSAGRVSEPLTRAGDTAPTNAPVAPWRPTPLFLDPLVSRVDDQFRRAGELGPGHGKVDLFGYLQPDRVGGAGMARDPFDRWQADYGALGGVRFQW